MKKLTIKERRSLNIKSGGGLIFDDGITLEDKRDLGLGIRVINPYSLRFMKFGHSTREGFYISTSGMNLSKEDFNDYLLEFEFLKSVMLTAEEWKLNNKK